MFIAARFSQMQRPSIGLKSCVPVFKEETQVHQSATRVPASHDLFDRGAYLSLVSCASDLGCSIGHDGAIYPPQNVWGTRG